MSDHIGSKAMKVAWWVVCLGVVVGWGRVGAAQDLEDDGWLVHLQNARQTRERLKGVLDRGTPTADELADLGGALSVFYCVLGPRSAETAAVEKGYLAAARRARKKELARIRGAVDRLVAGSKEAERRGLYDDAASLLSEAAYLVPEDEPLHAKLTESMDALEGRRRAAMVRRIEGAIASSREALREGKLDLADGRLWNAQERLDASGLEGVPELADARRRLEELADEIAKARREHDLALARRYEGVAARFEKAQRYGDALLVWEIIENTRRNELGPEAPEAVAAGAEYRRVAQLRDGLDASKGLALVRRGEDAYRREAWAEARGLLQDGAEVLARHQTEQDRRDRAWDLIERIENRCERGGAASCWLEGLEQDRHGAKGEDMVGMGGAADRDFEDMVGGQGFAGALMDKLSIPESARQRYGITSCTEIAHGGRLRGVDERQRDVFQLRARLEQLERGNAETKARWYGQAEDALRLALIGLAGAYVRAGDSDKALTTLAEAEAMAGTGAPQQAARVEGLRLKSKLLLERRDVPGARAAAEEALALVPDAADLRRPSLQNALALVMLAERRPAEAQTMLQEALASREQVLGASHPFLTIYLNNLAVSRWQQGDPASARAHIERALGIWREAFGEHHQGSLSLLTNLAILQRASGDLAGARASHAQALRLAEEALGATHPTVVTILENLASVPWEQGNLAETRALLERVSKLQTHLLDLRMGAQYGGEAGRLAFAESLQRTTDTLITLHGGLGASDEATGRLAFEALLQRKGRVLDLWVNATRVEDTDVAALRARWRKATDAWSSAAMRGPAPSQDTASWRAELGRLQDAADQLSGQLAAKSARFSHERGPVTTAAVQEALPANAALIEFALYRPYQIEARAETEAWGAPRYVAYVLLPQGPPQRIDLGDAGSVDADIARFRAAILACGAQPQPCSDSLAETFELGQRLYGRLMEPVVAAVGDRRHLLVSPDGELHVLPFDALVTPGGYYVMEERLITLLDSGRGLLRPHGDEVAVGPAVVVADPAFGASVGRELRLGGASLPMAWTPLPGTAVEARSIASRLEGSPIGAPTELIGADAREETVRGLHSPRLLHLATHGFFLGGPDDGALADGRGFVKPTTTAAMAPAGTAGQGDPMLRSGLLLANANGWGDQPEKDGVLTAREVAALDLAGTRLVVLSACETGLGEVRRSQGVFGLRRAFAMAGAETLVMSLFPVPDEATSALMAVYYDALMAGAGRSQAMRAARLALLQEPATAAPVFWSAFVVAGDWRTLDGQVPPPVEAAPKRPPMRADAFKVAPGPRGCACEVAGSSPAPVPWALLLGLGWWVVGRRRWWR